ALLKITSAGNQQAVIAARILLNHCNDFLSKLGEADQTRFYEQAKQLIRMNNGLLDSKELLRSLYTAPLFQDKRLKPQSIDFLMELLQTKGPSADEASFLALSIEDIKLCKAVIARVEADIANGRPDFLGNWLHGLTHRSRPECRERLLTEVLEGKSLHRLDR